MPGWKTLFPVDLAEEGRLSRREFARFLALVSAGFTGGIGWLALRRKPLDGAPGPAPNLPEGGLRICAAAEVPPGGSRLFTFRDPQDRCVLIHLGQDQWRAYRQTCTHLGCAVRWDGRGLECPCHNGRFEVEHGFPVQGPPTRPLSALRVEVVDGAVWVRGDLPKPSAGGAA